jgi:hypothetical protein
MAQHLWLSTGGQPVLIPGEVDLSDCRQQGPSSRRTVVLVEGWTLTMSRGGKFNANNLC